MGGKTRVRRTSGKSRSRFGADATRDSTELDSSAGPPESGPDYRFPNQMEYSLVGPVPRLVRLAHYSSTQLRFPLTRSTLNVPSYGLDVSQSQPMKFWSDDYCLTAFFRDSCRVYQDSSSTPTQGLPDRSPTDRVPNPNWPSGSHDMTGNFPSSVMNDELS
jgi:hypothetical protein